MDVRDFAEISYKLISQPDERLRAGTNKVSKNRRFLEMSREIVEVTILDLGELFRVGFELDIYPVTKI